jgi:hypothetical protein
MSKVALKSLFALLIVISLIPLVPGLDGRPPTASAAPRTGDWWTINDDDFVNQYGNLAVGTQLEQSRFAWMAFARANQQISGGGGAPAQPKWETWWSNAQTFGSIAPPFAAANRVRTRPDLEPLEQLRQFALRPHTQDLSRFANVHQGVTRNEISYNYIRGNHLNTNAGLAAFLNTQGNQIQLPLGAVETKGAWLPGAIAGAYQLGGQSLTGLHLMVKVRPTPASPFTDNSPSWFWTTFELNSNAELNAAQRFITYSDTLPAGDSRALMTQAGLNGTVFMNYVSNGSQIQFFDANHSAIILGNTQLEGVFGRPPGTDPTHWTSWSSSCHSCHAQASGKVTGSHVTPNISTTPVGPLQGGDLPGAGSQPYDFVWSLTHAL